MTIASVANVAVKQQGKVLAEKQLRFFAKKLRKMEEEFFEERRDLSAEVAPHADAEPHEKDRFHARAEDDIIFQLAHTTNELSKVQLALRRVTNDLKGTSRDSKLPHFGRCLEPGCQNWISLERLKAIPETPICGECSGCFSSHQN